VALLILILIFLVGIGLSRRSTTDIMISNNMKTAVEAFYGAESGLDIGADLVEQNLACSLGFDDPDNDGKTIIGGRIMVTNLTFWRNEESGDPTGSHLTNDAIIAYYPPDYDPVANPDAPHTNIAIGGPVRFAAGAAIQMAAGYEGLGKGAGAGGANIIFSVVVDHMGARHSSAMHEIQWIHKIGLDPGDCIY
jgi:hypothetical protein